MHIEKVIEFVYENIESIEGYKSAEDEDTDSAVRVLMPSAALIWEGSVRKKLFRSNPRTNLLRGKSY